MFCHIAQLLESWSTLTLTSKLFIMVLSSGKIPGHSGTEFKHKKAFQGRSLFSEKGLPNPKPSGNKPLSERRFRPRGTLWWGIKLILVSTFLASILTVSYFLGDSYKQASQYAQRIYLQEQQRRAIEQAESYRYFLERGEGLRRIGQWDIAQENYRLALKALPDGVEALRGMTLTLLAKCYLHETDCQEAEIYIRTLPVDIQAELEEALKLEEILGGEKDGAGDDLILKP